MFLGGLALFGKLAFFCRHKLRDCQAQGGSIIPKVASFSLGGGGKNSKTPFFTGENCTREGDGKTTLKNFEKTVRGARETSDPGIGGRFSRMGEH